MINTEEGIKSIKITTENVESFTIDGKNIGFFLLDDIEKDVGVRGCDAFGMHETAKMFAIEIKKGTDHPINTYGLNNAPKTLFERLTKSDITIITVVHHDNSEDAYYVTWNKESEYTNPYQKAHVNENGNLYIVIHEKYGIYDVFPKEKTHWLWMRDNWGSERKP